MDNSFVLGGLKKKSTRQSKKSSTKESDKNKELVNDKESAKDEESKEESKDVPKYEENVIPELPEEKKQIQLSIGDYSLTDTDVFLVGHSELEQKGLIDHHISSTNTFYREGINQIITKGFIVEKTIINEREHSEEDKSIDSIKFVVKFTNVKIGHPSTQNYYTNKEDILMPNTALLSEKTYSANVYVDAEITAYAYTKDLTQQPKVRKAEIKDHKICRIPIMVKSDLCNDKKSSNIGGYFIVKGVEWVIDSVESMIYNKIRIFKNEGYGKEIFRSEFISKPGDAYENQGYLKTVWYNDGSITFSVVKNNLRKIQIPFYLLFRLLGVATDEEMFDNIIYEHGTDIGGNMFNYLRTAMNAKYTIANAKNVYQYTDILKLVIDELKNDTFKHLDFVKSPDDAYQYAINSLTQELDFNVLPHVGLTPIARKNKIRFLGLIIRKIFLTRMELLSPTDRDSFTEKRIHPAGPSYAKPFKTYFNAAIVQQIKKKFTKDFKSSQFSQVDLKASFRTSIHRVDFERLLVQSITSGNKAELTVGLKRQITNRLFTQLLVRKNQLTTLSTMRQVSIATSDTTRQSERAKEMRRVHTTFLGYICVCHSPVGAKVGINKQMALLASVSQASSSEAIASLLRKDVLIITLDKVKPSQIYKEDLSSVFVNGDWIGCTKNSTDLVRKYRKMKRFAEINKYTTIHWDNTNDDVFFWTDAGRMLRPLVVVYNNKRDESLLHKMKKSDKFVQGIGLNVDIIDKIRRNEININDLSNNGIVEYVSPEEQTNYYICCTYDKLKEDQNNELNEYTHLDFPESTLSLTALSSPFANHNNTQKFVYQTNQVNQACGNFSPDWPFRCDKDTFLQYRSEIPMVKTILDKYTHSNGNNAIIGIGIYLGDNQEDGIIFNKGASDRGAYNGCKMTYYKTELEQNEEFGNPNSLDTTDIRSANYSKIINGFPKVGTKLEKGDVMIGKRLILGKNENSKFKYADRSMIYKENEPAIVHNVIIGRNEDEQEFIKIQLRKIRNVANGDKFCLLPTAEILTELGWIAIKDIYSMWKKNEKHGQVDEVYYHDNEREAKSHTNQTKLKVATMHPKTHELQYAEISNAYRFDYDDLMFKASTPNVSTICTLNHKNYVKIHHRDSENAQSKDYQFVSASDCHGKTLRFKSDCENAFDDYDDFVVYSKKTNAVHRYAYDIYAQLLAILIMDGEISINADNMHEMMIYNIDAVKLEMINAVAKNLKLSNEFMKMDKSTNSCKLQDELLDVLFEDFARLSISKETKYIPNVMWKLGGNSCFDFMMMLMKLSGTEKYQSFSTSNVKLADDFQRLVLHCELSSIITEMHSGGTIYTVKISNIFEPVVYSDAQSLIPYSGKVYCVEVPNHHLFYYRENRTSPPIWTGNSSKHGQKGIVALSLRDSDMPRTEDGMSPIMIINPAAIPTRMTISQLLECLCGTLCALKGNHIDGTIFKKLNMDTITSELEKLGYNKYGYRKLYSGITGEPINTEIYIGSTYYQRLQKFVVDTIYSVSKAPTDAITYQPLDGKANLGGLRIGEMEAWALCGAGVSRFQYEKFSAHSDKHNQYICRCGKPAIVNTQRNIYKCLECGDNADITNVPTTWSSKLLFQELDAMCVGVRRLPEPFAYPIVEAKK
jgi:DNA-directed RNA polymerase beta subunit